MKTSSPICSAMERHPERAAMIFSSDVPRAAGNTLAEYSRGRRRREHRWTPV
jgi:hypothetical protein